MSPAYSQTIHPSMARREDRNPGKITDPNGLVLEAWAQGFMVGALIIMACITIANMRRGVLLHKLILVELLFGIWQGFYLFFNQPIYSWWLSVAAIFLNASWSLHNVIAWMKNKPFFSRKVSYTYIGTVILVQPYWVVEIYANFTYFHHVNTVFLRTRPWEALCRDPWWIFTTISLIYNIKTRYELSISQIIRVSPRFAVMLLAMVLSIAFIILDILSVTDALSSSLPVGINPFWKLAFVFKCLTDSVVLDDFKTALDRLRSFKIRDLGSLAVEDTDGPSRQALGQNPWHGRAAPNRVPSWPSPDGDYINTRSPWHADPRRDSHHFPASPNPSKDRDSEENFPTMVHGFNHGPPREASDAKMLRSQKSWLYDRESTGSDEYARAVRELTNISEPPNIHRHYEPEKGIGTAV